MKCWAFAPPGGLADPHVAEAAQEFCTSVFLGKDWIPRLTVHSFERLRDEMVSSAVMFAESSPCLPLHSLYWSLYMTSTSTNASASSSFELFAKPVLARVHRQTSAL